MGQYHFGQVVQGVAAVDGVDAHGLLADAGCAWLVQQLAEVCAGFGLLAWRHRVFEVVCDGVDAGQAA